MNPNKQQIYLCIDYSGSTGNNQSYWNFASNIVESHPDAKFIFWDTNAKEVSYKEAKIIVKTCRGFGGTQPQCIVNFIPKDSHLIIITDGQIGKNDVSQCDNLLNGRAFSQVDVYFVNTGGEMNLSVSAPFTRNTKFNIYQGDKLLSSGSSDQVIELKKYYDNPELFLKEADDILKQIVMQNLGKNNTTLRNNLLDLQKNLLKCIAVKNAQGNEFNLIRQSLKNKNYNDAITKIKSATILTDSSQAKKIEGMIQELIRCCSGMNDFSFEILQPGRLSRAAPVTHIPTEELPPVENYDGGYECPITLDKDIPCCLIKQGEPVLLNIEKNYLDALMTNPFLLLQDSHLVEKLKERLDQLIGLEALKELFSIGNVKSPLTRNNISCAITLGNDKTHTKSTNYALADLLFGKKLVGQPELWLAVLYFVIKQINYLNSDTNFIGSFISHMIYRMENKNTNITLSGLPIEPLIKCPVDIAIWYCVISPIVVINNTKIDDARNRLRSFGACAKYLIELVDLLGYPYERKLTIHQLSLYKAFAWMMNEEKNHSQWRKILRSQYQGSLVLDDGTIIMLDGPSINPVKLQKFKIFDDDEELTIGELLTLADLVDQNKSINSVMIPLNLIPRNPPTFVKNYGYRDNLTFNEILGVAPICPQTFRPYVIDLKKRKHWKECSEKFYGPLSKQLSSYNYFNKFVMENNSYPSKQEFIKYLASKQSNKEEGAIDTLPSAILHFVDSVFIDFEKVLGKDFKDISPSEFKRRVYNSMKEEDRIKLDCSALA